ncbi:MAG TPA: LuxR C-terminal-related transcriptional regulator [Bacteroidales bacterium]|nr:LuxR C-terminal-related transcriptional regulator [Bacteroidales bacterium]
MENVNVIIADLSPLSRFGMISLLRQLNYPFSFREVSVPEKLKNIIHKDQASLVISSASFLEKFSDYQIQTMLPGGKYVAKLLINDLPHSQRKFTGFNEIIEFTDTERTILRKLNKTAASLARLNSFQVMPEEISDREKDVLRLVALGNTNKEIAGKLFISSHTVITHRKNITAKLGIKTIAGLTIYALLNKLITSEEIN